ncbi:hypothetical protein CBL_06364 [Carabus blaptoides fortunei]
MGPKKKSGAQNLKEKKTRDKMKEMNTNSAPQEILIRNEEQKAAIGVEEIVNVLQNETSKVSTEKQDEDNAFSPSTFLQYDDPTDWPTINDKIRTILVSNGTTCSEENLSYPVSTDTRSFSYKGFFKTLSNGEQVKRSWLIYIKSKNTLFCFRSLLFSEDHHSNFANLTKGFNNWRHLCLRLRNHENSPGHRKCYVAWKDMERRLKEGKTINTDLEKQIHSEVEKWRHVVKVIVDIILFSGKNNLPLRGSSNIVGDFNCGFATMILY